VRFPIAGIRRPHGLTSLLPVAVAALVSAAALPAQTASDLNRVKVGEKAPAFDLPAAGGSRLTLDALKGKNVVLVFYRGYW
jgi:cytochrome oxidase Cu insertion factor (SCO1/SenC/PrrC family)